VSDKTIRVSEETWRDLRALKGNKESFDDLIARVVAGQGERWSGFGALSDAGVADGMNEVHERLGEELTPES
jgi:predicted CopG family antitoxin